MPASYRRRRAQSKPTSRPSRTRGEQAHIGLWVPAGLVAWYDRRAAEQEVTRSELIRGILQATRAQITGAKYDESDS